MLSDLEREVIGKTVIVTTTQYPLSADSDRVRAKLAQSMVRKATDKGYQAVIVDSGSADEVLREFERYGAEVHTQEQQGMGTGRR